jgi:mannose-1-phosphate guanylyltransferase/mannose-6-phosphate isomerase
VQTGLKVIVLAGGEGTRLWPLSREDFPKQFLNFGSGPSLLQRTVQRLFKAPFVDAVLISTNAHLEPLVQAQLQKCKGPLHTVIEPARRNTAPAIALAVKSLETQIEPNDLILVIPSDHLIEPEETFLRQLYLAMGVASQGHIVTFGIKPTRPETGYGYIEIGRPINDMAYAVRRFIEKPHALDAAQYVQSPHFFWNSGMFLFSAATFWSEMQVHAPQIGAMAHWDPKDTALRFPALPNISIDYALMEKTKKSAIWPLNVLWSDIGSWDSVYEYMEKDENHNVKIGRVLTIDTKNSLIIGNKRLISTIGLENMLIVETDDAIFISKKGESQKVKQLVQQLASLKN